MRGLMPCRSTIIQPKAFLCFLSTFKKDSSWPSDRLEDMTIEYDSLFPRNANLSIKVKAFFSKLVVALPKGLA